MRLFIVGAAAAAALSLAACGGGGEDQPVTESSAVHAPPPQQTTTFDGYPSLPLQTPTLVRQAPIVDLGGTLHVGADVAPARNSLTPRPSVRGVTLSSRIVRDGISRGEMIAYLRHDASQYASEPYPDGFVLRFDSTPPVVRVAEGTPPELTHIAVHAVQLVNASLPHGWQLRFSDAPGPAGAGPIAEGEIVIEFAPFAEWPARIAAPGNSCTEGAGCADWNWAAALPPRIVGGKIWIDPGLLPGIHLQSATVHELVHFLGRAHADPERFTSVMASSQLAGHMLFPLDRETLLAIYGRLTEGIARGEELASTFGPWADTSVHIRGDIDAVDGAAFGVRSSHNGLAQAWAFGPTPHTNLADNRALSGTASWSGFLAGFGFGTAVGGTADLSIELATLRGELDFAELTESMGAGTETTWGDGDLGYAVRVRGNTFVQTGGDDGIVTGIFVGSGHEGMAGTLRRDDLEAAFGGSR